MQKQQLKTRLGTEATERIIRRFNDGEVSLAEAQEMLGIGKSQVYNLRTEWLSSKKSADFLGVSGGDHTQEWPQECVEHLKIMIEASKDDGPNFALYADELERKFAFKRDRANIRKWCERNIMTLMRSVFPIEKTPVPSRLRRWERASYGELYQHDSTPRHIWGAKEDCQHIILSLDDATRKVMASRVCERETIPEHFAMLEESFLRYGVPETLYTDGFAMFGHEGEDIKTQFGRMSRAFGIVHLIAPTPQAKGKIERAMRTFQHRLVVTLRAESVDNADRANAVTAAHCDFWNAKHKNEETGMVPDERVQVLTAAGRNCMRNAPDKRVLQLFLSQHVSRRVESGCRIDFMGRKWEIARTLRKTVWLAVKSLERWFYVLETRPDPTNPVVPRVLARYQF